MFTKLKYAFNYIWSGKDEDLDKLIGTDKEVDNNLGKIIDSGENFILTDKTTNIVFGTYTRRRDAVRGAARRGLKLAA